MGSLYRSAHELVLGLLTMGIIIALGVNAATSALHNLRP